MEKRKSSMMGDLDQKILASELNQGKELAEKLRNQFLQPSSSQEENHMLLSELLSTYEKALLVLTRDNHVGYEAESKQIQVMDSTYSFGNSCSPLSEISDQDCNNKNVFKKRKTMPKRIEKVKVCSGTGQDGTLDDGYSWRKYGQKEILGASHPRGYFRCTHRKTQGCPATKQVQKSDADPTILMVTYTGEHTCHSIPQSKAKQSVSLKQEEKTPKPAPERSFSFGLRVKTENLNTREDAEEMFPSFSFPSMPIESENMGGHDFAAMENDFMCGSYAPTFESTATFGSDYFAALLPCHFGLVGNYVQTNSESDLTHEIPSTSNSVANSPMGDFGFSLEDLGFSPI